MRETGTGQQVARLLDIYMMMMMITTFLLFRAVFWVPSLSAEQDTRLKKAVER
jgi:hypothetical protein